MKHVENTMLLTEEELVGITGGGHTKSVPSNGSSTSLEQFREEVRKLIDLFTSFE